MMKINNRWIQKPNKTKFSDLPEEIVSDIFTRLPTESVLECKLVSKTWRDVVRDPSFSQLHLNHHLHSAALNFGKVSFIFSCFDDVGLGGQYYYGEYDEKYQMTRINLNPRLNNPFLVGSCNGLICISYGPVYISNPITREFVILPDSERNRCWYGFGYVLSTNEYKVVRIYKTRVGSNVAVVQVYTLGSGTGWRNLGEIEFKYTAAAGGVFVNGALHWMDDKGTIVLAFHLADEKFNEFPAPPPYLTQDDVPYLGVRLGVLGDFLSATYYVSSASNCEIWLWKKNKDNRDFSWVKEFDFVLFGCVVARPFGFTKSGKLMFPDYRKIYSYDPKASSAIMDVRFGKFIYQAIPHKNTLVSLKVLGEKDTKTMESGKRPSSSLSDKVRDRMVGFCAMGMKKFTVAIQKLHLPKWR